MARRATGKGKGPSKSTAPSRYTPAQKSRYTRELKARRAAGQSEDYARRQARAKAEGKTQQEGRGHHAGEARERREREERQGLLHWSQKQQIKRFALRQADRIETDPKNPPLMTPDELVAAMQAWAQAQGFDAFLKLRDQVRKFGKETRHRVRKWLTRKGADGSRIRFRVDLTGRSERRGLMEQLAIDWKLGEWRWLFYH